MRDEDHTDHGNGSGNDIFNDKSRSSRINVGSDTRVDGRHLYTSRCSLQRVVGLDRHFVDRVPPQPACLEDVIRAISFTHPSAQAHPSSQTKSSTKTHPSTSSLPLQLQQQPLVLLSSMGAYHFLPEEDAFPTDLHRPHRSRNRRQGQGGNTRGMTAEEDEDYDEDENEDSEFGPSSLSKEGEGMAGSGGGNTGVSTEATLVRRAEVLELFAMVKAADNVLGDRRTAGGGRPKDSASASDSAGTSASGNTDSGTAGTGTTVGREGVLVVRSMWSRLLSDESSGGRMDGTHCGGEGRAGERDRDRTYPGEGNAGGGGGGGSSTSRNDPSRGDPSSGAPSSDDLPSDYLPSDYLSTNRSSGNAPFSNTPSSDDPPGEGSSYDSVDSSPAHHASLNRSHTYAVSMGDTHILLFVAPRDHRRAVRAIR